MYQPKKKTNYIKFLAKYSHFNKKKKKTIYIWPWYSPKCPGTSPRISEEKILTNTQIETMNKKKTITIGGTFTLNAEEYLQIK